LQILINSVIKADSRRCS